LDLLYQSILGSENRLIVHISDRKLISDSFKANKGIDMSLLVQNPQGTQKFKLLEKFITEDLWGAQLVFVASGNQNKGFNRDIQGVKLELAGSGQAGDKREEQFLEQFKFEKGKLVY